MDYKKSCQIMGVISPFTHNELKKKYYKLALKYHPDHNPNDPTSTERFQELYEAYSLLSCSCSDEGMKTDMNTDDVFDNNNTNDYVSLFKKFLSSEYDIHIDTTTIVGDLIQGCKNASFKVFENLDKKTAMNVFQYMEEYSEILGMDDTIKNNLKDILREKIKDDVLIVLNSTIENLFNADIYKLEQNGEMYYVPLWHDELTFDMRSDSNMRSGNDIGNDSGNDSGSNSDSTQLVVKCVPNLPEHMKVDHNNHLHIYINVCFTTLLKREKIDVQICNERLLEIPVCELRIMKKQVYTFYRMGIPLIHTENIFSTEKKGNVYVHIEMTS
jgi:DnaJ-class molecular chaperone